MFFEKQVIGVDLGTTTVKVAYVRAGKDGPELLGAGVVPLPEGAVTDAGVVEPEQVAAGIREALSEAGVTRRTRQAVAGIPGKHLTVRAVTVPSMDHSELREAVKWEAAQYLPYPAEEGVFDFVELGAGSSAGTLEVVSVSARKGVVDGIVRALELAGLEPLALDAVPLALGRVFFPEPEELDQPGLLQAAATSDPLAEQALAIADVGAASTDVSIFLRGRLRVSRSIPLGGGRFTAAIAQALDVNVGTAEGIKLGEARLDQTAEPEGSRAALIAQAVRGVAEELGDELQRSLDYFRAQSHWLPVNRLRLAGDGAKLPGLDRFLAEHLGLRIDAADVAPALPGPLAQAVASGQVSPVCLGLALWEVNRA